MHQRELARLYAGRSPGKLQLALGGEAVNLVVAIAVGGEDAAVLGNGHAGRHVEGGIQSGAVGRNGHHGPAAAAQFEQFFTVLGVLGDDVVLAVGDPNMVFSVDEDTVRLLELSLAPGGNEFSRCRPRRRRLGVCGGRRQRRGRGNRSPRRAPNRANQPSGTIGQESSSS